MMTEKKKIAIVGGGFSGVGSIISLKEEGGFDPICFEKTDKIGGTWCYREESVIGVPSIMPTTIINHSKELGAISNFPPDKEYSNYMKHDQLYKYFRQYASKWDAFKHVRLNSEVIEVKRSLEYEEKGTWIVTVKDTMSGSVLSDIYDGVLICVGHINIPKWPSFKCQDKFKGTIIHTHSLKGVSQYTNKNVVIVGMGCSGLDAAVEISKVAQQVYLSTRSGAYVFNRVGPHGYPIDYIILRRYLTSLIGILPINFLSWGIESLLLDPTFNSRLFAVKPKYHILSTDPIFNDHICSSLLSGSVIQKDDIESFTENGVIFKGESTPTQADCVIMATGYTWNFPFLEDGVIEKEEDGINLYKCTWPPTLKHATLAFVGFFLSLGPGFPLGEIQVRWIVQVLAGKCKLPPTEEVLLDIKKKYLYNRKRYNHSNKQSFRVDYTQYLDEVAELIGAKPNLLRILFTDPKLFWKLMFGPSVPYQYRLQGPHTWEGARDAIMTCDERVHWPLKKSYVRKVESSYVVFLKKFLIWLIPFV